MQAQGKEAVAEECAAAEAEAEAEESEARTSAPGDTPAKNAQRRDESSSEISRAHVVPPAPRRILAREFFTPWIDLGALSFF